MVDLTDSERRHPILVTHVARADGTRARALRVYCDAQERSVSVDVCRKCPGCRTIEDGDQNRPGLVCCTPALNPSLALDGPSVGDSLREGVVAVEEDVIVRDVVTLFVERRLRLVVVVDREGRVTGVVHESNLLPQIQAHPGHPDLQSGSRFGWAERAFEPASSVMSRPRSIPESMSLRAALDELAALRHQRLVAVDADGLPVGTLVDVHALHALRAGRGSS